MNKIIITVALSALASPAFAMTDIGVRSEVVRTADLDLTADPGRSRLERRLVSAAKRVCGLEMRARLGDRASARKCLAATLAKARLDGQIVIAAAERRAMGEARLAGRAP